MEKMLAAINAAFELVMMGLFVHELDLLSDKTMPQGSASMAVLWALLFVIGLGTLTLLVKREITD